MHPQRGVITVRMPSDVLDGLKALSRAEGESIATIVRSAIRATVANGGVALPRVGAVRPLSRADK
jgi:hypothetical protein